ncbi:histidine kinase [Streptomyces sp. NPDC005438]|uniref:sensor histidine kinase n=1 Tax=Streptomyces sp. NPDC005438 TaxID=3156880 RepID=UPI0033ABDE01
MTDSGDGRAVGGPLWWNRTRSAVLDISLAVASAVECAIQGVLFARDVGLPTAIGMVVGVLVGSALVFRRRAPLAVVLLAIAITPTRMGLLLGCVGLYTLSSSNAPRRVIGLLASMMAVGGFIMATVQLAHETGQDGPAPFWFVLTVSALASLGSVAPPVLLGLYVGQRRRLVESLRERADGLERELSLLAERAEERAEWARNEERTRIAREMHDVVAHRVSLMVVHAAALQATARKDPRKASHNAGLIGDMGRQALTELRTMLGVLRAEDGGRKEPEPERLARIATEATAEPRGEAADGPTGEAESAEREGPRLAQLESLVGESRAAGMAVELSVQGEARGYAALVEQTAYRVVQEALTNVHKHASGARTRVRLARREDEVAVQVENEPPGDGQPGAGLPSGGNGLVGMRERVSALGGTFVCGPTDAGGFRVSAIVPDAC